MKKIIKLCEYIAFIVFIGIIIFEKQKTSILLAIPIILLLYLFTKKTNDKIKNYALFIFIVSLVTRIISTLILKVEIVDDFKTMYDASLSLLNKDLSFMNGFYFRTYTYQLGLVLFQALFLKIFKSVAVLKIINSLITSSIVLLMYLIIKKVFNETSARFLSLAYLFYLYPIYLNSVLTNQHIQSALMLLVIYLLLYKKESIKLFIVIALILGISNFFRTESIIFILGLIIYNLVYIRKDNYKNKLKNIATILITYLLVTNSLTLILYSTPLFKTYKEDSSLVKNVTYWKFYCGLNIEHNGIYNEEDVQNYFTTNDEKKLLIDRIKQDYKKYPLLFLKKEVILWTQTNYDIRMTNDWTDNLYNLLFNYNQGFLNLIMILFAISLFPKKEETKKELIFLKILLALYFGVYLFIEISPRYAYIIHMLVFIVLGIGLEKLNDFFKYVKNKEVEKVKC